MASALPGKDQLVHPFPPAVQATLKRGMGGQRFLGQYFYLLMSLLMALVVLYGFSRTIPDKLVHPAIPRPFILYLHAWVSAAWIAFFICQTAMVCMGRVRWHRVAGKFGVALGAVVFVVGIWTAIAMARFNIVHFQSRYADLTLLVSLYDITAFAVPLALAIYWRRYPERHRRLMLVATCALMAAAFGRFPIPPHVRPAVFFYAAVDSLIVLGIARDWIVTGRAHRVYVVALIAFVLCQTVVVRTIYHHSPYWLKVAHVIIG